MGPEDGVYEVWVRVQLVVQDRVECFQSIIKIKKGGYLRTLVVDFLGDLQIINQSRMTFITQQEIRC